MRKKNRRPLKRDRSVLSKVYGKLYECLFTIDDLTAYTSVLQAKLWLKLLYFFKVLPKRRKRHQIDRKSFILDTLDPKLFHLELYQQGLVRYEKRTFSFKDSHISHRIFTRRGSKPMEEKK